MGGGINVPLEVRFSATKAKATEFKHALMQKGFQVVVYENEEL